MNWQETRGRGSAATEIRIMVEQAMTMRDSHRIDSALWHYWSGKLHIYEVALRAIDTEKAERITT
jgi:hypothetical protein